MRCGNGGTLHLRADYVAMAVVSGKESEIKGHLQLSSPRLLFMAGVASLAKEQKEEGGESRLSDSSVIYPRNKLTGITVRLLYP